jgi:hypothetical protein
MEGVTDNTYPVGVAVEAGGKGACRRDGEDSGKSRDAAGDLMGCSGDGFSLVVGLLGE